MTEGFNHRDYSARYPNGDYPEEGAGVFQRRAATAPEPLVEDRDERDDPHQSSTQQSLTEQLQHIPPRWRRALRFGSAIGALLLIIYIASKAYQVYRLSPEQLYTESFQPYVLPAPGPSDTGWSRFEAFYRQGSMDSIIRAARKKVILSEKETFIAGLAYLIADDPFWSIRQLKKLTGQQGLAYAPQADFYLALAYLKNRDYDHALTLMLQIRRRPGHPYKDQFSDEFIERVKLLKWR